MAATRPEAPPPATITSQAAGTPTAEAAARACSRSSARDSFFARVRAAMRLGVPSGEHRGELGHLDDGLDGLGKQAVGHALLEGAGVAGRGQGRVNGQLAQGNQVKVVGRLLKGGWGRRGRSSLRSGGR